MTFRSTDFYIMLNIHFVFPYLNFVNCSFSLFFLDFLISGRKLNVMQCCFIIEIQPSWGVSICIYRHNWRKKIILVTDPVKKKPSSLFSFFSRFITFAQKHSEETFPQVKIYLSLEKKRKKHSFGFYREHLSSMLQISINFKELCKSMSSCLDQNTIFLEKPLDCDSHFIKE